MQHSILKVMGQNLKRIRKARNQSLEEVGNHIGMKKSSLSRIENGLVDIKVSSLHRLVEHYECDYNDVFRKW